METNLTNSIRGREGEDRVLQQLEAYGYMLYPTHLVDPLEPTVDRLCWGHTLAFWVQVKHKQPRRVRIDTGLELERFNKLKERRHRSGIPALLLFTDRSGLVYGNWVDNLKGHYGWNGVDRCEMIYFDLPPNGELETLTRLLDHVYDANKEAPTEAT